MEAPAALRKRDIFYVASIMGLFILNLVGLFRFTARSSHHEVARLSQRLSSVEENTEWVMDGLEKHLTWHERVNLAMKASKEKGGEGAVRSAEGDGESTRTRLETPAPAGGARATARGHDEDGRHAKLMCLLPYDEKVKKDVMRIGTHLAQAGCDAIRFFRVEEGVPGAKAGESTSVSLSSGAAGEADYDPTAAHHTGGQKAVSAAVVSLQYPPHVSTHKEDTTGKDVYHNLWQKTHHMLIHTLRHETERHDWYVKIDYDTVFIPANFRRLAAAKFPGPLDPAYLGHKLAHYPYDGTHKETWPASGSEFNAGGCYALNRAALERLVPALEDVNPHGDPSASGVGECSGNNPTKSEDASLGMCLRQLSPPITPNTTRDDQGREHFMPFQVADHLDSVPYASMGGSLEDGHVYPDWFWANKDKSNEGRESMAKYIVSAHNYKGGDAGGASAAAVYDRLFDRDHHAWLRDPLKPPPVMDIDLVAEANREAILLTRQA